MSHPHWDSACELLGVHWGGPLGNSWGSLGRPESLNYDASELLVESNEIPSETQS